jgi:hypothetical protein
MTHTSRNIRNYGRRHKLKSNRIGAALRYGRHLPGLSDIDEPNYSAQANRGVPTMCHHLYRPNNMPMTSQVNVVPALIASTTMRRKSR